MFPLPAFLGSMPRVLATINPNGTDPSK